MQKQDEKGILSIETSWMQMITGITIIHKIKSNDIRQSFDTQTTLLDKVFL